MNEIDGPSCFYDSHFRTCDDTAVKSLIGVRGTAFEDRFSLFLTAQMRHGLVTNRVHPEKVMAEIFFLEGKDSTSTGPAKQFTSGPLKGFWKKHWFQPSFMGENLRNHMGLDSKPPRRLEAIYRSSLKQFRDPHSQSAAIAKKAVEYTFKGRKLTGEWIIFQKHEGKNYYLALGFHLEDRQQTLERIRLWCSKEFPFLFEAE